MSVSRSSVPRRIDLATGTNAVRSPRVSMHSEVDLRDHDVSCADSTTQAFERLAVHDSFVFVADHDPTALRYLFEAEWAGQFTWDVLAEDDDGAWRVQVSRIAVAPSVGTAR